MRVFGHENDAVEPFAAANPAWRRGLQSVRPVGRVAELGSLGVFARMGGYSSFTLFALGGYVFAAIFLCAGFYLRSKTRRLIESGLVAKGTVVAIESATSMSSDSVDRVFHPVFEFRDMQGVEHRVRSAAGSAPASHKIGDIVEVLYHAHSPHEAIIDSRDYIQMVRVCFFAGIVAVVIATIIVILEWK